MANGLILAIDQGTTNTKALLVDRSGSPVFRTSVPLGLSTSRDGFVEQDPLELWNSVVAVCSVAVFHAQEANAEIKAIGISNQRETAIAWDAVTGEPLAKAISWQCGRSALICERIASRADFFRAKTGLPLAPLVSAGKWTWLLENVSAVQTSARESTLRLGTVDSWLLHRMTCGEKHATDLTNASRTGLFNLSTLAWDSELLDLFSIPNGVLPKPMHSAAAFGSCRAITGLEDVPVLAMIGDSHAAMVGHGHFAAGSVKSTYGTGSSIMALTSTLVPDTTKLARTIAWSAGGNTQFALEGNIPMTGAAIQWLGEFLHFSDPSKMVANLASTIEDAGGVYFVPAMLGLGAPHWDPSARGSIVGLERQHSSAHLARAAIDSAAYQVADVLFAIEAASGSRCSQLLADGGATRNSALMQFQADILGRPVLRSQNEELSALGAAWLAGMELGWSKSFRDLESIPQKADRFDPETSDENRERLYQGWKRAVESVRCIARASR